MLCHVEISKRMVAPMPKQPEQPKSMGTALLALGGAVALVAGAAFGTLWLLPLGGQSATEAGQVEIGGPFALTDHTGRAVTDADFAGKHLLIYFGFTYCPDVCPTRLLALSQAMDQLTEAEADQVQPLFITVDPERDTVEAMNAYVGHFSPRLVGLTGTPEAIAAVADSYYVTYYKTHPEGSSEYLVDHTDIVYLMDPDGNYAAHFTHASTPQTIADTIRAKL